MHKILTLLLITLLATARANAQALEEVNFGPGTNTHLTDINNRGFISGWYDSAGLTKGFVINPDGVITRSVSTPSTIAVKFMGINDHNVVLVSYNNAGSYTVYKAYYDTLTETLSAYVAANGNQQLGLAQPYGINNYNDMSGWYQGAAYRFLWALHDSVTTTPQWAFDKYVTYNTMGTGINDNGTSTGFAINGTNYYPYVYDVPTNTFTILNTTFKMKPWGINNAKIIVGEYQQTAGYYTAFWGPVVAGIVQTHAMSSLWQNPLTQSVANGINDRDEIVGEYVHPTTGNYVGFIYRMNINEYRLSGYDWNRHTYTMVNSTQAINGHNPVWSTNYYGGFNYYTTDPYANGSTPLITPAIINISPGANNTAYFPNSRCIDWKSMAIELDTFNIGTDPTKTAQYQAIWKPWAFKKWRAYTTKIAFPGICYGFAFSSLLRYADSVEYQQWFGIPATTNLYTIPNTNSAAVTAIARTYIKQNDKYIMPPFGTGQPEMKSVLPWSGLFRLKNCYQDPVASRRNPRAIFISEVTSQGAGCHSILPFKIKTPKQFPFNNGGVRAYDTLFVYDSNYPGDSTVNNRFIINSDLLYSPIDSFRSTGHNGVQIAFNEAGIKEMLQIEHGRLKGAGISEQPYIAASIGSEPWYTVHGAGGTTASYNGTGATSNIPYFIEMTQKDTGFHRPSSYAMDTLQQVSWSSTHYTDSVMMWDLGNNHRSMSIARGGALLNQTDNSTIGNHLMTYGTHDAVTKTLTANLIEMNNDISQGVNVMATNITANNGDSIVTSNPSKYVYRITRIAGTPDVYDLWIYVAGADDSVRQFKVNNVPLGPNTTHTIDPYASGPNGTSVTIQVDNGNNGTNDSSIILHASLDVANAQLPSGFVRIYPNPAGKMLNISVRGNLPEGSSIEISDVAGRTFIRNGVPTQITGRHIEIPLGNIPAGTYLIRIVSNKGAALFSDKFVRE